MRASCVPMHAISNHAPGHTWVHTHAYVGALWACMIASGHARTHLGIQARIVGTQPMRVGKHYARMGTTGRTERNTLALRHYHAHIMGAQ